jgi:hypothetical protein
MSHVDTVACWWDTIMKLTDCEHRSRPLMRRMYLRTSLRLRGCTPSSCRAPLSASCVTSTNELGSAELGMPAGAMKAWPSRVMKQAGAADSLDCEAEDAISKIGRRRSTSKCSGCPRNHLSCACMLGQYLHHHMQRQSIARNLNLGKLTLKQTNHNNITVKKRMCTCRRSRRRACLSS